MIKRDMLLFCSQENLERLAKWLKIEFDSNRSKKDLVEKIYWKFLYP